MKKAYILGLLFLLLNSISYAQPYQILCSEQTINIKIENTSDIPTFTDNGDGTITLNHSDQNISDIFNNYTIHDFFQAYPSANPEGELIKYYTIVYNNRDLVNELHDYAYPEPFEFDRYESTPLSSSLIDLLDNKTYNLISLCSNESETSETCEGNEIIVASDFELKIAFNYDSNLDIIRAETVNSSPCGNSFSIGLRGGYDDLSGSLDNKVQLWESDFGISSESDGNEPCFYIEEMLYGLLDIGCLEGRNLGNLKIYEGTNNGQIILERDNGTFSNDFMTFQEDNLSIKDNVFEQIKPYKTSDNPYLQISNSENQSLTVEIISISGQTILQNTTFETNAINLSNFSKGIYFIKLKSLNNQQKVFKFLNN